MKRHGLALCIAHYRSWKYNFLYRYELNGNEPMHYYFNQSSAKPGEIVKAVCFRYLRIKGLLTVGNWNRIIEIVANRVSCSIGARPVIRSLEIQNREKKRVRMSEHGRVITCGTFIPMSAIYARRKDINIAIAERKAKEKEEIYKQRVKASISLHKAKSELSELRSITKSLERVLKDGKEYNQNNQGFAC